MGIELGNPFPPRDEYKIHVSSNNGFQMVVSHPETSTEVRMTSYVPYSAKDKERLYELLDHLVHNSRKVKP